MDSRTLSLLADQAEVEVEAALRREREGELHQRLLHSDTKAKKEVLRLLRKEICAARDVRNIRIPIVFAFGMSLPLCVCEWNFCQEFLG
jgi:hypothetical protein